MTDGMSETVDLIGAALPELNGDVPLIDQQADLLRRGLCAFDLVHFLAEVEGAFTDGHIVMTATVADLYRQSSDVYEKLTVAMIVASWDGILRFFGPNPDP